MRRLLAALSLVPALVLAQDDYPSKPIRMILPTSAGSGSDVLGRVIADRMRGPLGQPVVVENRPGAAGVVGINVAKSAPPDGYTLVFGNLSSVVMAPLLVVPQPYDPVTDFEAIAAVYRVLITFSANSSVPASNLRQFVEYAKKNPGKLNY